jgi:hypothetical protein
VSLLKILGILRPEKEPPAGSEKQPTEINPLMIVAKPGVEEAAGIVVTIIIFVVEWTEIVLKDKEVEVIGNEAAGANIELELLIKPHEHVNLVLESELDELPETGLELLYIDSIEPPPH